MTRPISVSTAVLAVLAVAACSSGTTANPPAPTPAPKPGEPAPPAPTTPGKGPAVAYKPFRAGAYRLERHDSLTLQYPGGATQEQVRDRVAYLHVTVADAASPGTFGVTVVLDSLQALESGQPASPDSVLAARGTRWTATLSPTSGLGPLTVDRQGTLPDELTGRLGLLFPGLPAGGVREGWSGATPRSTSSPPTPFPGPSAP